MKASLFCAARYIGKAPHNVWPLSEALAFIAGEFFERRDLFLVSRESSAVFP